MLAGQIADDGNADDAAQIAAGVHDAAHGHGLAAAHVHGRAPIGAFIELNRPETAGEPHHRQVRIGCTHRHQQQRPGNGQRNERHETIAPAVAEANAQCAGNQAAHTRAHGRGERR